MAQQRFSAQTYQEKRTVFRLLFQVVDYSMNVDQLIVRDAQRYLGKQAKERSGHAANKDRKNLQAAWSWGILYMALPKSCPFKATQPYPENKKPRYIPPQHHIERILETESGEVRLFLLTMLHTAARRGELLRLKWSDVDLERQTIRLSTRKRKSGSLEYDQIPMTGLLKDELKAHWPRARSVYVFCKEDGRPFTERRHLMTRVCRRSNVPYFGFHAIRHLSATMMDQAGVPLRTIQAILRHKSATTTDRYLHSLRGERVELDGVFEGGKGKIIKMGGE
jgi:integrase